MVQALLEGRKSQTRRILKPQPNPMGWCDLKGLHVPLERMWKYCPSGQVGDRLWVRETWCDTWPFDGHKCEEGPCYKATDEGDCGAAITGQKWKHSIFMPRWASRIALEITDIRVERLDCMSENDAHLEGVDNLVSFKLLWDKINKKRGYEWEKNCWVWVLEFRRV